MEYETVSVMDDSALHQLSPYIRVAWYNVVEPEMFPYCNAILKERQLFDYEIIYIKSGRAKVTIEGCVYYVRSGHILLIKPRQRHTIEVYGNEQFVQPHLHFDFFYEKNSPEVEVSFRTEDVMSEEEKRLFREDITDRFMPNFPNLIELPETYLFEQYLFDIINEFEQKKPYYKILVQSLFCRLWYSMLSEMQYLQNKHITSKDELVSKIQLFLEHNVEIPVSMKMLADAFNLDKIYLSRLFKQKHGVTPSQYHTGLRIQRSIEMLLLTNNTLTEISEKVGFATIHDFSRTFKKRIGISPSVYRNTQTRVPETSQLVHLMASEGE